MKQHACIVGLSLAAMWAAFSAGSVAEAASPAEARPAQSGAKNDAPDKRPEVAGLVEKFSKHVQKRGNEDTDAIALITELDAEFAKSGPKDKKEIVNALSKAVEAQRAEPKKGEFNNKLAIASAEALGKMGPESVATLNNWIGHKNLRRDIDLQRQLILSLGKTRDNAAIKTLTSSLENKDAPIVAAAAEAMGEFAEAKLEVRKDLFSAAIKCLMTAKNSKDAEQSGSGATANTNIATERYDVVAAPLMTTLHKLSKHDESTPELWERWWNKNRQANWDSSKP